jgi:hypothetical protein
VAILGAKEERIVLAGRLLVLVCCVVLFGAFAAAASADTVVADNGFRPDPNGFSFENYGNDSGYADLSPVEMQKLFGPGVCVNTENGCTLTPPAQQWMDQQNKGMGGGHCQGMAMLSQMLFKSQFAPFGSGPVYGYEIKGNTALQRSIAYAFVFQFLDSVVTKRVKGTPDQILQSLRSGLNPADPETYTLGIYKPDGSGGHAITPFAVVDRGGGMVAVQVYDNNYPGKMREVVFNTNDNTWSYNAATNPSVTPELYSGTAGNSQIELDPTTVGLGVQPCPFCQPQGAASEASGPRFDTVQLSGNLHYHAHLVIGDGHGGVAGIINGRIVNTFPGAQVQPTLLDHYSETEEPAYLIPVRNVSITIDGSDLRHTDTETLSSVGPGQDVAIQNLKIGPRQRPSLKLIDGVQQMSFTAAKGQGGSPVLRIGVDSSDTDYALKLKMVSFHPGATLHVKLNPAKHLITFRSTANAGRATYVVSAVDETRKANTPVAAETVELNGTQAGSYSYAP